MLAISQTLERQRASGSPSMLGSVLTKRLTVSPVCSAMNSLFEVGLDLLLIDLKHGLSWGGALGHNTPLLFVLTTLGLTCADFATFAMRA